MEAAARNAEGKEMRYLAIFLSVLMLAACGSQRIKQAMHADCRLQGYEQGTREFSDCVTVATHNFKMQYYLGQQARTGQAMQAVGQQLMQSAQPQQLPLIALS